MSELKVILLLNEWDTGGQQGIERQGSTQVQQERSGRVASWWAEVPHLIRLDRASNWKMLSAGRRRAASDIVPTLPTSRALSSIAGGPPVWQGHMYWPCHTGGPPH